MLGGVTLDRFNGMVGRCWWVGCCRFPPPVGGFSFPGKILPVPSIVESSSTSISSTPTSVVVVPPVAGACRFSE